MGKVAKILLLAAGGRETLKNLRTQLQSVDVDVEFVESAAAALQMLTQHEFAVAVIDVQMPEVSAFQLVKVMRASPRTDRLPIILVTTGEVRADYAAQGYESGASDCAYVPMDDVAILSKVKEFIDMNCQRTSLSDQVAGLQHLQDEQQHLLDQLLRTQAELEKAMRLRDEFISVVSHELRTPLNTLKLELYARRAFLESGDMEAFSRERLRAMFDSDERQQKRLLRLINDMTDVSRIRTGQLSINPMPFDIAALLRTIVHTFANQIEVAKCHINLQAPQTLTVTADEVRIEQAIINLLTNALRHCNAHPIDLSLTTRGADAEWIRIVMRDYGRGVKAEDKQRIFHLFERGDYERKGSGLGLGLFIAHKIVAAHGGRLELEEIPGDGALFALTIPRVCIAHADIQ